jgi:hydrogenase nickel incorporation protein HypA/HybF
MHELSIALGVLDVAEEEADRHGDARITAIHLRLGPLSGVVKDALLSAYDLAREGTRFAACDLRIEEIPIRAFCPTCQAERSVESMQMLCCAICGTATPDVLTGRELEVTAMEIAQ